MNSTGLAPRGLVLGDWNNDGLDDIATANSGDDSVSVLMSCGDGRFRAVPDVSTSVEPTSIAHADLDGDGNQDLVTQGSQAVSVLLGNGDGTFRSQVHIAIATATPAPDDRAGFVSIAVADVDHDGHLDVAAVGDGDSVALLLGIGDGSLQLPISFSAGHNPRALAVAELNEDDNVDIVVSGNDLVVLQGHGDGTFTSGESPGLTRAMASGDFTGDGHLDVVASEIPDRSGSAALRLFPGNGDGTFGDSEQVGSEAQALVAGDFDDDGLTDLAGLTFGAVSVFLQRNGAIQAPTTIPIGDRNCLTCQSIASGDVDDDGHLDLAVGDQNGAVIVLIGDGTGHARRP